MPRTRDPRYQNYTWLIYPESAVPDYMEICKDYHIAMYLSLHNKDMLLNKETGKKEPEKDHIHVLTMFDSQKALDCLDELIAMVHGVKPPPHKFIVQSKRGLARYLSHMDEDPNEKYPYYLDPDHKIISIGGAEDYYELCKGAEETRRAEMETTKDIQDYCEKKAIRNVATFMRLCRATDHDEWIEAVKKNSYFWGMWFRSYKEERPDDTSVELRDVMQRAKAMKGEKEQ